MCTYSRNSWKELPTFYYSSLVRSSMNLPISLTYPDWIDTKDPSNSLLTHQLCYNMIFLDLYLFMLNLNELPSPRFSLSAATFMHFPSEKFAINDSTLCNSLLIIYSITHVYAHVCILMCLCIFMDVCVRECVCICVLVPLCAWVCMCVFVPLSVSTTTTWQPVLMWLRPHQIAIQQKTKHKTTNIKLQRPIH